jgi:hypothetical protein
LQSAFQQRLDLLHRVLRSHSGGLSEYELIKILENENEADFSSDHLRDSFSLFQTHFLLFHALYHLQAQLWESQAARLEINALCIQLLPFKSAEDTSLTDHDPLRDYYLDLNNLKNTDASDVERLLTQFWSRFVSNDDRHQALATLGLKDPVDWPTIKTQHRRLAMEHHPDRGGDEARLQAINSAMDILARDSRHSS